MVVSGAASRARRVPRSVSRKRERGASPPTDCAFGDRGDGGAAIAGRRPPLVGEKRKGREAVGCERQSERRGVFDAVV
jgi:hypothetical protein